MEETTEFKSIIYGEYYIEGENLEACINLNMIKIVRWVENYNKNIK